MEFWQADAEQPIAVREVDRVTGAGRTHRPARWLELRQMRIRGALEVQADAPGATLTVTGDVHDGAVRVVGAAGVELVDIRWSAVRETHWEPPRDLPPMRCNS